LNRVIQYPAQVSFDPSSSKQCHRVGDHATHKLLFANNTQQSVSLYASFFKAARFLSGCRRRTSAVSSSNLSSSRSNHPRLHKMKTILIHLLNVRPSQVINFVVVIITPSATGTSCSRLSKKYVSETYVDFVHMMPLERPAPMVPEF
jgi:hypothetical protein